LLNGVKRQRYLILPAGSILAWLPLLVTTGITQNRMLLGVPADMLIILFGAVMPLDLIARYIPVKIRWISKLPLWIAVALFCYHSISTYFFDYLKFPNL
jgi:hypothetical protein